MSGKINIMNILVYMIFDKITYAGKPPYSSAELTVSANEKKLVLVNEDGELLIDGEVSELKDLPSKVMSVHLF